MKAVIQRVSRASVTADGTQAGRIGAGLMVLLGVESADGPEVDTSEVAWLAQKVAQMRIFSDADGHMNLSVADVGGDILVVSQFTLFAQTKKGNRPSWFRAARHEISVPLYEEFCRKLSDALGHEVGTGEFGADMKVELLNDGPVTICMDTKNKE